MQKLHVVFWSWKSGLTIKYQTRIMAKFEPLIFLLRCEDLNDHFTEMQKFDELFSEMTQPTVLLGLEAHCLVQLCVDLAKFSA